MARSLGKPVRLRPAPGVVRRALARCTTLVRRIWHFAPTRASHALLSLSQLPQLRQELRQILAESGWVVFPLRGRLPNLVSVLVTIRRNGLEWRPIKPSTLHKKLQQRPLAQWTAAPINEVLVSVAIRTQDCLESVLDEIVPAHEFVQLLVSRYVLAKCVQSGDVELRVWSLAEEETAAPVDLIEGFTQ